MQPKRRRGEEITATPRRYPFSRFFIPLLFPHRPIYTRTDTRTHTVRAGRGKRKSASLDAHETHGTAAFCFPLCHPRASFRFFFFPSTLFFPLFTTETGPYATQAGDMILWSFRGVALSSEERREKGGGKKEEKKGVEETGGSNLDRAGSNDLHADSARRLPSRVVH